MIYPGSLMVWHGPTSTPRMVRDQFCSAVTVVTSKDSSYFERHNPEQNQLDSLYKVNFENRSISSFGKLDVNPKFGFKFLSVEQQT
jgi:hypothetical protein